MSDSNAKRLTLPARGGPRKTLLVRTAAGPAIGFGHLRRTLILARRLRRFVRPLFLLDSGDRWSLGQVAQHGFASRPFRPRNPRLGAELPAGLLIDTRRMAGLHALVGEARRNRIPVASIHDLGLAPLASDVVVDGSMPAAAGGRVGRDAAFFAGTAYLVLDDSCARFHNAEKRIRSRIRRVVVNLGGGDGGSFFHKILTGLRSTCRPLEVIGFPGFCTWGQEELTRAQWKPIRFRWLSRDEDAVKLMFEADLAVTAGGLAAYEALCLGVPLCALSCDRHQAITVEALARAGGCIDLGRGAQLKASDICRRFTELEKDYVLRRRFSAAWHRLVDGGGARRVARIIRTMIKSGSRMMSIDD